MTFLRHIGVWLVLLTGLTTACVQENASNDLGGYINEEETPEYQAMIASDSLHQLSLDSLKHLDRFAQVVLQKMDNSLWAQFAEYFHPTKGCTFSPYTDLNNQSIQMSSDEFKSALQSDSVYVWGNYDGSGESISLNCQQYLKTFVYSHPFLKDFDAIHLEDSLAFSNTLNTVADVFPEAEVIEYYWAGSDTYDGMDWQSLLLYAEKSNNRYYLVAIVHNQWTI